MAKGSQSNRRRENWLFLSGLICSGAALIARSNEYVIPETDVSLGRTMAAALLVEFGSRIQNGCTSGHGICGLSRLSFRSAAAVGKNLSDVLKFNIPLQKNPCVVFPLTAYVTGMFMIAGFASATIMDTASVLGVNSVILSPAPFSSNVFSTFEYRTTIASILALAICTLAARKRLFSSFLPYTIEFLSGFSFGCGLVIGGMTNPSKVASFLTLSSTLFDPSLMFVMAGGIAIALPGFQFIMHLQKTAPSTVSLLGRKIDIPTNKTIDLRLIIGSLMFGSGWGLLGLCPGPAVVSIATLDPRVLVFGITYAASFLFFEYVQPSLPQRVHAKKS